MPEVTNFVENPLGPVKIVACDVRGPIWEQNSLNAREIEGEGGLKRGGRAAAAGRERVLDTTLCFDDMGTELANIGNNVA